MAFPNRELSQFGSFLLIDDNGNTIGIATTATPTIGIGTTSSDVKLTVIGDTNISGVVRASQYFRGNDELIDVTVDRWSSGDNINIYRLNGYVGLGNSFPTEKLDVTGNISAGRFISTVTSGTAPLVINSDTVVPLLNASFLGGKTAPSGAIVGDIDIQTLANKTIQNSRIIATGIGITFNGSTSGSTNLRASAIAGLNTVNLPLTNGILVSTGDTGSVTSNMILDGTIVNTDISTGAGITYTKLALSGSIVNTDIANGTIQNAKLANSTISGVSLGSTLANLTAGTYINYNSGTTYNGSLPITISANGSSLVSGGNNLVARDGNGDFFGRNITGSNLYASTLIQGTDFNSLNTINVNSVRFVDQNRNISAGIITATRFVGDGSGLTLLSSGSQWVTTSVGIHTLSKVGIGTTNPKGALDINVGSASTVIVNYGYSQLRSSSNSGFSFTNNTVGSDNTTNFLGNSNRNNIFGSLNPGDVNGYNNNIFGNFNIWAGLVGNNNNIFGRSNHYNGGTLGNDNNIFGSEIFYNGNSTGSYNNLIGNNIFRSGYLQGSYNIVMGFNAASPNTISGVTAANNVILGTRAANTIISGSDNVAIGQSALNSITTGNQNVALGSSAGINITTGSQNVAIGYSQTVPILTGSNQLVIGAGNTSWIVGNSSYNVGIGTTNPTAKLSVNGDVRVSGAVTATRFVGDGSGLTGLPSGGGSSQWITTSAGIHTLSNVGIGTTNPTTNLEVRGDILATRFRGVGSNNFFGFDAGCSNTTGTTNNFFGSISGRNNTTGSDNSFFGNCTGSNNTIGNNNNFFGLQAGIYNTTGNSNNFFGKNAGIYVTSGSCNIFFGTYAGSRNTIGSNNIFLGYYAGRNNQTGFGNVIIGHNRQNTPILNGSNQLVIGSGANDWIYGNSSYNVGIGTTNPTTKLDVVGNMSISGISTFGLSATSTAPNNSQLSFELISNTQLRFKVRGTDGVLRSATVTLA